jgi:cob(I)alamin adenosyltransferase
MKIEEKKKRVKEYFRATEVGMMIEVFQDQMKMVAENLAGFREKAEERFDLIGKRFDKIDARLDGFVIETSENFEIVRKYLSRVTDDLDKISAEIKEMKSEPEKIDFDRVAELEKEVEHLKKEINRQGKLIQLKLCA